MARRFGNPRYSRLGSLAAPGEAATKERGVYAASTLGVRQPVKPEEGLESWKESKFILQMNLQDWRLFPVGHFPHGFRFNAPA